MPALPAGRRQIGKQFPLQDGNGFRFRMETVSALGWKRFPFSGFLLGYIL